MGELSRCLGQPTELPFEGKTYKLSPITIEVEAAFEQWLEGRARAALRRSAKNLSPEEYKEDKAQLTADIASGVYSYGGPVSAKAVSSALGQKQLLFLMLKAVPQAEGLDADGNPVPLLVDMGLVDRIFDKALDEVMSLIQEMHLDPNPIAPGEPGLPSAPCAPASSAKVA